MVTRMKHLPSIVLASCAMLLAPTAVWAWGPGVHMALGNYFLAHLELLAPALAQLLASHPNAFLYGSLSADIFIGKGSKNKPRHSHNWSTAFELLAAASGSRNASYAYGYLAHLAADTVAHNYYVPTMLGLTSGGGRISHALVELRADWEVEWSRDQARGLFQAGLRETDRRLMAATKHRAVVFLLKRLVYKRGLALGKRRAMEYPLVNLRRIFAARDLAFPGPYCQRGYCHEMIDLALAVTLDLLKAPAAAAALAKDPIGAQQLKEIKGLRPKLYGPELLLDPGRLFPLEENYKALLKAGPRVLRP